MSTPLVKNENQSISMQPIATNAVEDQPPATDDNRRTTIQSDMQKPQMTADDKERISMQQKSLTTVVENNCKPMQQQRSLTTSENILRMIDQLVSQGIKSTKSAE